MDHSGQIFHPCLVSLSIWHSDITPFIEEYSMHSNNCHIAELSVAGKWMCYQEALQRYFTMRSAFSEVHFETPQSLVLSIGKVEFPDQVRVEFGGN